MTYIDNGRVTRDSRLLTTRWTSYFSWKRFLIIVIPTMILLVTNPVNEEYINTFNASITRDGSSSSFSQKTFNFGREKFVFGRRITNYAIFSLEESFDSMKVYALRHSWTCSFTNFEIGSFCDALSSNLCHQKPLLWEPADRAYTTHRFLYCILILSSLFFFCCPNYHLSSKNLSYGLLSVFYRPNLFWDLMSVNYTIYPTLIEMNRIIPKLRKDSLFITGEPDFDFILGVFLLVVMIGGGSNMIATKVTKQNVWGFSSVVAAHLTYFQRIALLRRPILVAFGSDQPVTAAGIYWTNAALIILKGNSSTSSWPRLVAWIVAGCAGNLLAKYHVENISILGGLFKFLGFS